MAECPYCNTDLSVEEIRELANTLPREERATIMGSMSASLRQTIGREGGKPRDPDKPRCACGAMTLKRFETRGRCVGCEKLERAGKLPAVKNDPINPRCKCGAMTQERKDAKGRCEGCEYLKRHGYRRPLKKDRTLYSAMEVAYLTGMAYQTILRLLRESKVKATKDDNGSWWVKQEDLTQLRNRKLAKRAKRLGT